MWFMFWMDGCGEWQLEEFTSEEALLKWMNDKSDDLCEFKVVRGEEIKYRPVTVATKYERA